MQSIYKNNDRKVRHLGSKRFGIQFLIKGIYTYNGMLYVHTQTKNSSNVPFDTDFIKFKIVDKKVPKRTAIQETVLDAVRSYNEVIEIAGKSTVRLGTFLSAILNLMKSVSKGTLEQFFVCVCT